MADEDPLNQSMKVNKLSSADLAFFETPITHSVRDAPTPDDSVVPSHPVGNSSQGAHRRPDSSGYFHTTPLGGMIDDSNRPVCPLDSPGGLEDQSYLEDSDPEDAVPEDSGNTGASPITPGRSSNSTEDEDRSEDEPSTSSDPPSSSEENETTLCYQML